MNINDLPIVQSALERGYFIYTYKLEDDALSTCAGPYRIGITSSVRITEDTHKIIISGATLDEAIAKLADLPVDELKEYLHL